MRWILAVMLILVLVCGILAQERGQERGPIRGVDIEPLIPIPYSLREAYPSKTDRELRLMILERGRAYQGFLRDIADGNWDGPPGKRPQGPDGLRNPTAIPDPDGRKNVVDGPCEGLFWEPPGKDDTIFTIAVEPLGNNKGRYNIYQYSGGRWRYRGDAPVVMLSKPAR